MTNEDLNSEGLPNILSDAADLITGLPEPIRRNLFQAVGSLISASVDIPVAWLESKAQRIRDQYKGQSAVMSAAARKAAEMAGQQDEIGERALNYFAADLMNSQINRESIAQLTIDEMARKKKSDFTDASIDPDWLVHFRRLAGEKSNDEMRVWFARILAGEICQAGSFSPLTLNALSVMRLQAAQAFQKLCNTSLQIPTFGTFCSWRCATQRDVRIEMVHELQALGLVGFDSWSGIRGEILDVKHGTYAGHSVSITLQQGEKPGPRNIGGLVFLAAGNELRSILILEPDWSAAPDIIRDSKDSKLLIEFEGRPNSTA